MPEVAGEQFGGEGAEHALELAFEQALDQFAHAPFVQVHRRAGQTRAQLHDRCRHGRCHRERADAQHRTRSAPDRVDLARHAPVR